MSGSGDIYRIRPTTNADLDVVLHHRRSMFRDMGFLDPAALDAMEAASTPLLRRGLADGHYRGWLVETEDGRVIAGGGIVLLEFQAHPRDPAPQRAYVVNMYTEPEHRRKALARRLMQAMIDWARAEGLTALYLHASDEGRPLYAELGFKPTNEMRLPLR